MRLWHNGALYRVQQIEGLDGAVSEVLIPLNKAARNRVIGMVINKMIDAWRVWPSRN
jgi:hypothetical protein